jgi:hypothetical protein
MYPTSPTIPRHNRVQVDSDSAAFYAGTRFRSFLEVSLASSATLTVRMVRPVDIIVKAFTLSVYSGELRCEVYRGGTPSGSFSSALPVLGMCEFTDRPTPYAAQCSLASGGSISGGTLYDIIHVKTSGATAQQFTVGAAGADQLGIPGNSMGYYKFSNPSNGASAGIFVIQWEELPVK